MSRTIVLLLCLISSSCGRDNEPASRSRPLVRVAVAGNFALPHAELTAMFEGETGVSVEASLGATGQLYAQIINGAPFDIFLAADTLRPRMLEEERVAVPDTRFTYAVGRLVLYAPSWDSVRAGDEELRSRPIRHLAIANPRTAPYGAAAVEVLRHWELDEEYETRIVRGENVAQAFQFIESGASEAGIIALSQVVGRDADDYSMIPERLHRPIHQDAVLLRHGRSNPQARAYLGFLRSETARQLITSFGYSIPEETQ